VSGRFAMQNINPSGVKIRSHPASITVHQARYHQHISNMTATEIRSLGKPAVTLAIHSTAFSIYANHKLAKQVNTYQWRIHAV
jgi:hypothetical protein